MIVGYARVSTQKDEQAISVKAQVQQLKDAGCTYIISEQRSAYNEKGRRPGWEELQQLVASGKATTVVAISQSRLSRREDVVSFLRVCARKGITVRFLDGTPSDVAEPAAKLMTGVLATVNEVDSQIKSINILNGLKRRKAAGYYACGSLPFGYCNDGEQPVVDRKNWKAARQLWELLEAHEFAPQQCIRRNGLNWSAPGLTKWIHNPMLRGWVDGVPGKVDRLISPEEYARAKRLMDERKQSRTRRRGTTTRLLTGLVRCGNCGGVMSYKADPRRPSHYRRIQCTKQSCDWCWKSIDVELVRNQVIEALRDAAADLAAVLEQPKLTKPTTATAEQLELQSQLDELLDLQTRGVSGLDRSIDDLRQKLAVVPAVDDAVNWAGFLPVITAPGLLEASSDEDLRAVFLELVEEMRYIGRADAVSVTLRNAVSGNP